VAEHVQSGLDHLVSLGLSPFRGCKYGILTHAAAVDRHGRHLLSILADALGDPYRVFGPEHGLWSTHQDMEAVEGYDDPLFGWKIHSLYGANKESLCPAAELLMGLDVLFVDLQDVGARYYTYYATALRFLSMLSGSSTRVLLLDRPNPIDGATTEGGGLDPALHSFVGELSVPHRHGLTLGELVRLGKQQARLDVDLQVIPLVGWNPLGFFEESKLLWVPPSPNMPTVDTACVYPGMCLLEGTNLSEGRGTTTPFLLFGAPFLRPLEMARELEKMDLIRGCTLVPSVFRPEFGQKWTGTVCRGLRVAVTNRRTFRSLPLALGILAVAHRLHPEFAWRTQTYEFEETPAIDLLLGNRSIRRGLESGQPIGELVYELETGHPVSSAELEACHLYHRPAGGLS